MKTDQIVLEIIALIIGVMILLLLAWDRNHAQDNPNFEYDAAQVTDL